MRRKYTMEHFSERLTELHKALPDLAVTSDVIVGFLVRLKKNSKKLTTSSSTSIFFSSFHFSERLTELHKALPDLAVTSDVIVGFLVRLKKN